MATFALLPGAWHGAWCYEPLVAELGARGHEGIAVELPLDDLGAGLGDYARCVAEALTDAPEDAVVVGHSFGGLTIPLVPSLRPVGRLLYLAAFVPSPGISADDEFRRGTFFLAAGAGDGRQVDQLGRSHWPDPEAAIEVMFHDCPRATAEWAAGRLAPQPQATSAEPCPLESLPDVPVSYVRCADDRMFPPELTDAMASRLGVEPLEIGGGHCPMVSRPAKLADTLVGVVEQSPS